MALIQPREVPSCKKSHCPRGIERPGPVYMCIPMASGEINTRSTMSRIIRKLLPPQQQQTNTEQGAAYLGVEVKFDCAPFLCQTQFQAQTSSQLLLQTGETAAVIRILQVRTLRLRENMPLAKIIQLFITPHCHDHQKLTVIECYVSGTTPST